MGDTLWFDPDTGSATPGSADQDPPDGHWKVLREDAAVSVLARNAKRKIVLIGNGQWSRKGIGKRYAVSEPIDDKTWAKLESALHRLGRGDEPAEPADPSALVDASGPGELASAQATDADQPARTGRGDLRSGWWAFAAALVTAAGCAIAWMAHTPGDSVSLAVAIILTVGALGLVIYLLYGLGTRCPSCKAWYRRETTSTEVTGTSTVSRQESTPVYDSSGKQSGTTYQTVTYEVTNYRYYYRCKECSNRWTGSGSSERRV